MPAWIAFASASSLAKTLAGFSHPRCHPAPPNSRRITNKTATVVVSKQDLERADTDLLAAAARVARLEAALALLNMGARAEKIAAAKAEVAQAKAYLAKP